jgi:hypothetical protein
MDKEEIKGYQKLLQKAGLYDGKIDGIIGPKTSEASKLYEELSDKGYSESQMFRHSTGAPHMEDSEWDDYIKTGNVPDGEGSQEYLQDVSEKTDFESKDWSYLGEIKKRFDAMDWDDPKNHITVQNAFGKRWKIPASQMRFEDEEAEKIKIVQAKLNRQLWHRGVKSQRKAKKMLKAGYKLPPALHGDVRSIRPGLDARFMNPYSEGMQESRILSDEDKKERWNLRFQMDIPSMREIKAYLKNTRTREDSVINSMKKEDEWKVTDEDYKAGE